VSDHRHRTLIHSERATREISLMKIHKTDSRLVFALHRNVTSVAVFCFLMKRSDLFKNCG
jgi:hypothetical protein